ncbi:UNVERIFIED_CONTAM: Pyruvate carboxylase 1, partial [Eudyptes robustus]
DHASASVKMLRALREIRIRGVKTNIPFLVNVLEQPDFKNGPVDTSFIDTHPELFKYAPSKNRAQKLIRYLGEVKVNGPQTPLATDQKPKKVTPLVPQFDPQSTPPKGLKQILKEEGPEGFAKAVRKSGFLLTDTTLRDAHQSLLATRVRTFDMVKIAPFLAQKFNNLYSIEN